MTSLICCVLNKVLVESLCKIFSLCLPLRSISVGIARIKDLRIYTWKLSRNLEVEHRDLLGRCSCDGTIQDCIDDTTSILNGDTLSGTIPSGIYQICLCTALLHLLNQLFCVLCGETLDAIQQLTNYSINRGGESKRARVQIDAENYREKREESLERLAQKVAGKVVKYRRNVTLEPMNAYERHVIHTALQDTQYITTFSIGTEPNRRVVVSYDRTKQ